MNILDISIIAIFVIFIIAGYFKGLVNSILEMFGIFIGIILFKFLYPILNDIFIKTSFYTDFRQKIAEKLNLQNPDIVSNFLEKLKLPAFIKEQLFETTNFDNTLNWALENTLDYLSAIFFSMIMFLITLAICIILAIIIVLILFKFTKFISKLPVIKSFNHIGGALFGVLLSFIIVWIIGIVFLVLGLLPKYANLNDFIETSKIAKPIFQNNYLLEWLLNLLKNIIIK